MDNANEEEIFRSDEDDFAKSMEDLRAKVLRIGERYDPDEPVTLFDIPVYNNVGDQLIFLGELYFLDKLKVKDVHFVPNGQDMSNPRLYRGRKVLFQGGGNFGDIYPEHDEKRIQVLNASRGSEVEFLPQTLHYRDPANLDRMRRAVSAHGRVIIHVRDNRSYEFATAMFDCDVRLSPDMAHALWGDDLLKYSGSISNDTLYMLRRDIERTPSQALASSVDWDDLVSKWKLRFSWRACQFVYGGIGMDSIRQAAIRYWIAHCKYRVRSAVEFFGSYQTIVTSRLHGHILTLLIGRDCLLLDNSYGKNSTYLETWTKKTGKVRLISELSDGR